MKSKIYINEAPFTADNETLDLVIEALEEKGFVFDDETEGYVSPEFYHDKAAQDIAVYGPWGRPTPPTDDREYDWRNG